MSSVTAALGNDAPRRTLEHGGKTYTLTRIDQAMKSAMEQWVADCELSVMRRILPPEEYRQAVREVREGVGRRVYSFYGERARAAMAQPDGALKIASLIFGVSVPEMEALARARRDDVKALLELTFAESQAADQVAGDADPNG